MLTSPMAGRAGKVRQPQRATGNRIIAQRRDGFQRHGAGALHDPLVVLFEQDCAHEAGDRSFVREDSHDLGAALDLAIKPLDRIGRASFSTTRRASFGGNAVLTPVNL